MDVIQGCHGVVTWNWKNPCIAIKVCTVREKSNGIDILTCSIKRILIDWFIQVTWTTIMATTMLRWLVLVQRSGSSYTCTITITKKCYIQMKKKQRLKLAKPLKSFPEKNWCFEIESLCSKQSNYYIYAADLHREGHYKMRSGVCLSVRPSVCLSRDSAWVLILALRVLLADGGKFSWRKVKLKPYSIK